MGVIARAFERRAHPSNPPQWLRELLGIRDTAAGVSVTEQNALTYSAVYACVRVLAETLASLPLPIYRRLQPRGKDRAPEHRLYPRLHDAPNPLMTSFQWRETMMGHLLLWGNAFSEIELDGADLPIALWPLRPDKMEILRNGADLRYRYALPDGGTVLLPRDRVFHLRGLSGDGIKGLSPIALAREAIGLGLATQEFGARFFGNDSRPGGVLRHPQKLSEEAARRLKESWETAQGGLSNRHRMAVLEEGMEWIRIGIPPEEAQFLESRKFQATEIARIYRVPPHMIADLERATFSNIEHQSLSFVMHTMLPWLRRWEQEISLQLFSEAERGRFFAEFLVEGLLRGDTQSRFAAYAIGRQWSWYSANDVREKENENPIEGGDVYLQPLNMVSAGDLPDPGEGAPADQRSVPMIGVRAFRSASDRRRTARSFRGLFADVEARIIRREEAQVMQAAERLVGTRDLASFEAFLNTFYGADDHQRFMVDRRLPVYMSLADASQASAAEEIGGDPGLTPEMQDFVRAYAVSHVALHASSARGQLRQVAEAAIASGVDVLDALQERFSEWKERRPGKFAERETVQHSNAVSVETYRAGGVRRLRWIAFGPNCPYCSHLNGQAIDIDATFIQAGGELQPEGVDKPLVTDTDIRHAPAHGGCDCQIAAA